VLAGANAAAQRTTKGEPRKDVGKVRENRQEAGEKKKDDKKGFLGIF
jgi:hypothetical protein